MNALDTDNYVMDWSDFIGQERAKHQLRVSAQAAKERGEAMPHTLLASGLHGIGKTNLALLAAQEMGTQVYTASGKIKSSAARIMLSELSDGDVLFLDEIHLLVRGGKANSEWLLHLLQDGVILGPRGPEEQPDITVIGATTDVGRLPQTLISRFKRPPLTNYDDEEGARIANLHFVRIFPLDAPPMPAEDVRAVARAGDNNPRMIQQVLTAMRDLWQVEPEESFDGKHYAVERAFEWVGVLPDGLTESCSRYLTTLLTEFDGQAGEKSMRERLQEPGGLDSTERRLAEKGLIAFTNQGRTLTGAGIHRAKELTND